MINPIQQCAPDAQGFHFQSLGIALGVSQVNDFLTAEVSRPGSRTGGESIGLEMPYQVSVVDRPEPLPGGCDGFFFTHICGYCHAFLRRVPCAEADHGKDSHGCCDACAAVIVRQALEAVAR